MQLGLIQAKRKRIFEPWRNMKPSYVLIHGGTQGGWVWKKVIPGLRSAGHEVFSPTLTGCGERAHLLTPEVVLETHVQDVINVLH